MLPTLSDGLHALDDATAIAATISIELDEDYLRMIAALEAMPESQSGTDKSWVGRLVRGAEEHFRSSRLK